MAFTPSCFGGGRLISGQRLFLCHAKVNIRRCADLFRSYVLKMLKKEGPINDRIHYYDHDVVSQFRI
ncbi:MAG: hypothetical protein WBB19_06755 [Desulforhopalus sp.]